MKLNRQLRRCWYLGGVLVLLMWAFLMGAGWSWSRSHGSAGSQVTNPDAAAVAHIATGLRAVGH
jgi:hypothetical protein